MSRRRMIEAAALAGMLAGLLVIVLPAPTSRTVDPVSLLGSPDLIPVAPSPPPLIPGSDPRPAAIGPSSLPTALPTTPDLPATLAEEFGVSPVPRSVGDRAWEPVVAAHPTDPNRIAVVYQHLGPGAACSVNPIIRISHDGGRTWRSTKRSPAAGSGRGVNLHAAIAWGPGPTGKARLYWADLTEARCGGVDLRLSTTYSDDEGDTWSTLHVERSTPPWVGGFPEIAVDRDPASPNHGTVYVGYNWLARGARGPGFHVLASADFGVTWHGTEIPPLASPRGYRDWWRIAYRLRPGPDGSVYAAWYQVDLRRWDRSRIFAKGGPGNVGRLAVGIARIRFDRRAGRFDIGPPRLATTIAETPFTTRSASAPGTSGQIRPDPMWLQGFDIDHSTGRLYVAVGGYSADQGHRPRGTIRVAHSDDGGATWSTSVLPQAPPITGIRQSSFRPNLVAGPGFVVVTFHTIDDRGGQASVGSAYTISWDGGATWKIPIAVSATRWRASYLGGVVNGVGLRERAELLPDGNVFWVYGDGRYASGARPGRTAIMGARIGPVGPRQAD